MSCNPQESGVYLPPPIAAKLFLDGMFEHKDDGHFFEAKALWELLEIKHEYEHWVNFIVFSLPEFEKHGWEFDQGEYKFTSIFALTVACKEETVLGKAVLRLIENYQLDHLFS